MIASVHIADLGPVGAVRALMRTPKPADVSGLRWAQVALFAPLALSGPPPMGRRGLIAFWDDDDAIDGYFESDPIGSQFSGGVQVRMRPLRAHGLWPGLPAEVPVSRAVLHNGPVVVLTLGRLRISQTVRFLRASRPAEKAATLHDGMIWGSAATRPPFVATMSIWESGDATAAYAYGHQQCSHSEAIEEQQRKDFHQQSAFIRFAPTRLEGKLDGSNPLAASAIAT